ncbi:O-antigen polymerase [Ralstonia pseudosolanacearum]|uniref:O-antigen polymerase n=1 Tax=Ralstonia pseudosolanacearum TaxID=1310165 RepID=UPI001FF79FA7|nr:O-antigen polymerase [Ralstonia pseudosolanacearum]
MVNPLFIFFAIWALQVLGHAVFSEDFDRFSGDTWWILGAVAPSFVAGCVISLFFSSGYKKPNRGITAGKLVGGKRAFCLLFLGYVVFGLAPLFSVMLKSGSFAEARSVIVASIQNRDSTAVGAYYSSSLLVVFVVYLFSMASRYSAGFLFAAFAVALVAAVFSSGRTLLLLLFIAVPVSLYIQKKIRFRVMMLAAFIFVCAFLGLALLNQKGDFGGGVYSQISWNLKIYLLNGLACFNHFVVENFPRFDGSVLFPNLLRKLLGVGGDASPLVLPFVETPLPGNVYTALYPWYHDGGVVGVVVGFFFIGLLNQYLYNGRRKSASLTFYYSLSAYALIMTIFQDQYIQAYPLWVMAVFSVIVTSMLSPRVVFERDRKHDAREQDDTVHHESRVGQQDANTMRDLSGSS